MKLKIKSQPEDFVVEEIASLPLTKGGEYHIYTLEKKGWNTLDALHAIAKTHHIHPRDISYGGRKDRHAWTRQYIAIKDHKLDNFKTEEYSLTYYGNMDRPMGPDLIEGNNFTITIRGLEAAHIDKALVALKEVEIYGYPNYFDDQRFRSFDPVQGFFAEKILVEHYNGALKIYLTSVEDSDSKLEKERKKLFFDNWKNWDKCLALANTDFEARAFKALKENQPKAFLGLINLIPRDQLSMYFSAYQSYLWNEIVRRIIARKVTKALKKYPGVIGDYLFYDTLSQDQLTEFKNLKVPTVAAKVRMPDEISTQIYQSILRGRHVDERMFSRIKFRKVFFKSTLRDVILKPRNLHHQEGKDERNDGKMKLILRFYLPRGSYGTILLKRLFS